MDPLLIALIVLAVIAVGGWGYGTYAVRPGPAVGTTTEVVAAPGWVSPLGIIGLLAVVALVVMFATGWRPLVVAP